MIIRFFYAETTAIVTVRNGNKNVLRSFFKQKLNEYIHKVLISQYGCKTAMRLTCYQLETNANNLNSNNTSK